MELVCHIGTPKTASTFLQDSCARNPRWLARHGIVYPDMLSGNPNHITLVFAASTRIHDFARDYGLHDAEDVARFRRKLSDHVGAQVAAAPRGTRRMVMSSENLTGNLTGPRSLANLRELLAPHFSDLRFVVYLRRQDDAILSMYGEFLRRGFTAGTLDEFITRALGPKTATPYLYYRRMLSQWIDAFGREAITVRLYDRDEMAGGDILADFLSTVLGAPCPELDGMERSARVNVGLSAPALDYLRHIQSFLPFRRNGAPNPERAALAERIDALPSEPRPELSRVQSERIMAHFAPANDWLAETFFPDRPAPLFAPRRDLGETGNLDRLTREEFARFTRQLMET